MKSWLIQQGFTNFPVFGATSMAAQILAPTALGPFVPEEIVLTAYQPSPFTRIFCARL